MTRKKHRGRFQNNRKLEKRLQELNHKRKQWIKKQELYKAAELEKEKGESRRKVVVPDKYRPPVKAMSKACADLDCENCKANNCICDCHA